MAAAQRARWAAKKAATSTTRPGWVGEEPRTKKRKMSAAGRAAVAAAAMARWARSRAEKKTAKKGAQSDLPF